MTYAGQQQSNETCGLTRLSARMLARSLIHEHGLTGMFGQPRAESMLRDQDVRAAILQHEVDSLFRIGRIDRNICLPRFSWPPGERRRHQPSALARQRRDPGAARHAVEDNAKGCLLPHSTAGTSGCCLQCGRRSNRGSALLGFQMPGICTRRRGKRNSVAFHSTVTLFRSPAPRMGNSESVLPGSAQIPRSSVSKCSAMRAMRG